MKFFVFAGLLIPFITRCQSSPNLLAEVSEQLKDRKSTVSSVLSDPKYMELHPKTEFRELIKNYSDTSSLLITIPSEPGAKILVKGSVKDESGVAIAGALVYLYQTDSRGWYAEDAPHVGGNEGDMRHARLFGYVKTNDKGSFELQTIKPHGYPESDLPAHIHVLIQKPGYLNYVTEFLFDDDERLVGEIRDQALRNHFIISRPAKAPAPFEQEFSYFLILRKK